MSMKRIVISVMCAVLCGLASTAQMKLVEQVDESISSLPLSIDHYKSTIGKLKPALTNEQSRNKAQTWTVAAKLQFALYDIYYELHNSGKRQVDLRSMTQALAHGYEYSVKALNLDSIHERDAAGKPKLDPKTGRALARTKYAKEVDERLHAHVNDYRSMGSECYNVKNWDGALQCWEIFCRLAATYPLWEVPQADVAEIMFYRGVALWQQNERREAVAMFANARAAGYKQKEAYDYALVCLSELDDEAGIAQVAQEAYDALGTADPQYVRILVNNYLNNHRAEDADRLLDEALASDPKSDELLYLKGVTTEQRKSWREAMPYYERCVRANADNAQGQYELGSCYIEQAREQSRARRSDKAKAMYRTAQKHLQKAVNLDPSNEDAQKLLREANNRS